MECQSLSQEANTLSVTFRYEKPYEKKEEKLTSSKYVCGALRVEFEIAIHSHAYEYNSSSDYCVSLSVKFNKLLAGDDLTYTCKMSTNTKKPLLVNELKVCDNHWYQIMYGSKYDYESDKSKILFNVCIQCEISESDCIFASLYEDTQTTDFKLCSEDGSIPMHKTILAAHSPVLQTMLSGEWKESQEGSVALQDVSLVTLQHLKDYMYLNRLPESGLQELCALASYYMMQKLIVYCCAKLLNKLTTDEVIELSKFALRNELVSFYIAILRTVSEAKIDNLESKQNSKKSNETTDNSGIYKVFKKSNSAEECVLGKKSRKRCASKN